MDITTYTGWRECIEIHCGIPLTPAFVSERLTELRDRAHPKTKEFAKHYGDHHLERTIGWFERAEAELANS